MISRTLKVAGVSSLALLACMPNPSTAQFGVAGNKRKGGAASFEELNKLAAERAEGGAAGGMAGLEDMLGDLGGMDLGALMEGLDPNTLQDLIAEGMKDPAVQEMVSFLFSNCCLSLLLDIVYDTTQTLFRTNLQIDGWNARSHGRTPKHGQ